MIGFPRVEFDDRFAFQPEVLGPPLSEERFSFTEPRFD